MIRALYVCCGLALCVFVGIGAAALPATAQSLLPSTVQVHFLNAGNGDAAWVGLPDGSTAVIDCGPPEFSKQLLLQLQTAEVTTIDLLAPSRTTSDAVGGCADLVRYLNVQNVLWSPTSGLDSTARGFDSALNAARINRLPAVANWSQDYGSARLTLFNPPSTPVGSPTDDSQVLLLEYGASSVLFGGAIHQQGEAQVLVAGLTGRPVTVLRAADHGVTGTSSPEFLRALFPVGGPRAVVLSYSAARGTPHPDADVSEHLKGLRGALLSTAQSGAITMSLSFDGTATWSTER